MITRNIAAFCSKFESETSREISNVFGYEF